MIPSRLRNLSRRPLVTLLAILIPMILVASMAWGLMDIVDASIEDHVLLLEGELSSLSKNIYNDFSSLALCSVSLAEQVSQTIEASLAEAGINFTDLPKHPDFLESILAREYHSVVTHLQESKSSGAFIILDATVNPGVPGAQYSRAGIGLKNMESSAVHPAYYDIRYLRGPASIARENLVPLLPQWEMEFQVNDSDHFKIPMQTSVGADLPLSRQYRWCPKPQNEGLSSAMLCSVPLIATDGRKMGVAGLEIESMLFEANYSPQELGGVRAFCVLARCEAASLHMDKAIFAGTYSATNEYIPTGVFNRSSLSSGLNRYSCPVESFLGVDTGIALYPEDSVYEQEGWTLAVLIPEEDMSRLLLRQNRSIAQLIVFLAGLSIAVVVLWSQRCLRQVGNEKADDLVKHSEGDGATISANGAAMLEGFVERAKTLSKAEIAVFDLYVKGHTAKEIAKILFLSINTIKTHTKRIYAKLNVTSRKELLLYARMMEDSKQEQPVDGHDLS